MPINQYRVTPLNSFRDMFSQIQNDLLDVEPYDVGEWQSQKLDMRMLEVRNLSFSMDLPDSEEALARETGAHLPWAEDHFLERVGGEPLNPSPSEAWWPFAKKKADTTNAEHKSEGEAFSHTYPERMWSKLANGGDTFGNQVMSDQGLPLTVHHMGVRFEYGDLQDVVNQLANTPHTRQAFLPIWFPEDTGAVHGKRVPCTLGYHFAIRNNVLDITYYMRSTDLLRHFQDDIYLAGRLAQWMVRHINNHRFQLYMKGIRADHTQPLIVGELIFHTANMHIFEGDVPLIEYRKSQGNDAWAVI